MIFDGSSYQGSTELLNMLSNWVKLYCIFTTKFEILNKSLYLKYIQPDNNFIDSTFGHLFCYSRHIHLYSPDERFEIFVRSTFVRRAVGKWARLSGRGVGNCSLNSGGTCKIRATKIPTVILLRKNGWVHTMTVWQIVSEESEPRNDWGNFTLRSELNSSVSQFL